MEAPPLTGLNGSAANVFRGLVQVMPQQVRAVLEERGGNTQYLNGN